ncbi:unnamed protein product, partial [Brenthis ino]
MACGTKYAYVDNNVVEYEDAYAHPISLPYPYQEPKFMKVEHHPSNVETIYDLRNAVVPDVETQEISLSPFSSICSVVTSMIGCIKRAIMYIITSIPTLIFSFFGICNMTSLCEHFNLNSLFNVSELSSFVTPERLKRATEFVEAAIKKYKSL